MAVFELWGGWWGAVVCKAVPAFARQLGVAAVVAVGCCVGSLGGCIACVCTASAAAHIQAWICRGGMSSCAVAAAAVLCFWSVRPQGYELGSRLNLSLSPR